MSSDLLDIYHYEQMADWLGTSGQPTETQFQSIVGAGYNAVVNLAMPDSDRAIANEGCLVTSLGMAYFHIPVRFDAPTAHDLRLFFGVLDALRGSKVWVHCVVNARVSAFVFHYLTKRCGVSPLAAKSNLLTRWEPEMDAVWRQFIALDDAALA